MTQAIGWFSLLLFVISCNFSSLESSKIRISPMENSDSSPTAKNIRLWGNIEGGEEASGEVFCNGIKAEVYRTNSTWLISKFSLNEADPKIVCTYQNGGQSSTDETHVNFSASNEKPVADGTVSAATGSVPFEVTFDASASYDPDGTIAEYRWNFRSSGGPVLGKIVKRTFTEARVHKVTLTVKDNQGKQDSKDFFITATSSQNMPPVAAFTQDFSEGYVPLSVNFNASSSKDPDGTIVSYEWDIVGIGPVGSGVLFNYLFSTAGVYTVNLTVTDDKGAKNSTSSQVFVKEQPVFPVASFTYNPGTVHVMDEVTFDAAESYLPGHESEPGNGIADCFWFFEGKTKKEHRSNCQVVHQFTQPGTYNVEVTVLGINGETKSIVQSIEVLPAQFDRPVADFLMSTNGGPSPLQIVLNGAISYLPGHETEPDRGIQKCSWTLTPLNKKSDLKNLTGCQIQATLISVGLWKILLEVTSTTGQVASIEKAIEVTPNIPTNQLPLADFNFQQTGPSSYSFDGSLSTDPDGDIVRYEWDFGDGDIADGQTVSHTFTTSGLLNITLRVFDNQGAMGKVTKQIEIIGGNQNPVAHFSFIQLNGATFQFDGSSSSDTDGQIVRYTWDFGDGDFGDGPSVSHVYTQSGRISVILTVEDNLGGIGTLSREIMVEAGSGENQIPFAEFVFQPLDGLTFSFDAGPSMDPDGSIVQYQWDFGDGQTGNGRMVEHTYTLEGVYSVVLTVTDNLGATAVRSKSLEVSGGGGENQIPIANFNFHQQSGLNFYFDASSSFDPDGSIVSYEWSFGDGSTAQGLNVLHSFELIGTYLVNLRIVDDKGAIGTFSRHVVVDGASSAPTANFTYTQISNNAPFEVSFDASLTTGSDLNYFWQFGDGNVGMGQTINHTYSTYGTYQVTLDVFGRDGSSSKIINLEVEILNSDFNNGNFENGSLAGWMISGEVEVIEACTFFPSSCGMSNLVALISNRGDLSSEGSLRESFLVPMDALKLTGKIKFMSNEMPSLNRKNFDDIFRIRKKSGGTTTTVIEGNVKNTSLGSGVGGYKYASAEIPFEVSLIGDRGGKVSITFEVLDDQDFVIDSALAIAGLQLIREQ